MTIIDSNESRVQLDLLKKAFDTYFEAHDQVESELNDEDVDGHIDDLDHVSEIYITVKALLES